TVSNGVMLLNGSLTTTSAVNITAGLLQVAPNMMRVIRTPSLSITGAGKLDLTNNKLIVVGGAANIGTASNGTYSGISRLIQTGFNGFDWSGVGLVTSEVDAVTNGLTTLGIATADDVGYSGLTFGGVTVASGDLLVMYTY